MRLPPLAPHTPPLVTERVAAQPRRWPRHGSEVVAVAVAVAGSFDAQMLATRTDQALAERATRDAPAGDAGDTVVPTARPPRALTGAHAALQARCVPKT